MSDFLKLNVSEFIKNYKLTNCTVIKFISCDRKYIDSNMENVFLTVF